MGEAVSADDVVAWSSLGTAIFTLGLVVVAVIAWRTARKTLEASTRASQAAEAANEQARLDSIEQTRPYIYVELVPSLAGIGQFDVRITNVGRSTARSLTLATPPGQSIWTMSESRSGHCSRPRARCHRDARYVPTGFFGLRVAFRTARPRLASRVKAQSPSPIRATTRPGPNTRIGSRSCPVSRVSGPSPNPGRIPLAWRATSESSTS